MKKITSILICILLCLSLFGCSTDGNTIDATEVQTATLSTSTVKKQSTVKATENTDKASAKGTEKSTTEKAVDTTTTTTAKATTKNSATTKATKSTATTKAQTTTSAYVTCTVKIECTKILENEDKLKDGHQSYVPSNGIILNTYTVTVKNGATAYDAVKQACSDNSVTINAVSSSYGIYIAGFNNIDEKDCGAQSGWMYTVNGSYPSKSCDKYILKSHDSIAFTYTC